MPKTVAGEIESGSLPRNALNPTAQQNMTEPDEGYHISRRPIHRPSGRSSNSRKNIQFGDIDFPASQITNQPKHYSSSSYMSSESETNYQECERSDPEGIQDNMSDCERTSSGFLVSERPEVGMNKLSSAHEEKISKRSQREELDMCFDEHAPDPKHSQTREYASSIMQPSNTPNIHSGQGNWASTASNVVRSLLGSGSSPSVFKTGSMQNSDRRALDRARFMEELRQKGRAFEKVSKKYVDLKAAHHELQTAHHKLAQEAQQIVDRKEELERATHHLIRDGEKMELEFRADIQRLTSERDLAQENYEESMLLVRKQQEESFKHMNTGRWLPMEDNKVIDELSQIKGDMRDWAKTVAVNSMDALKNLDHSEFTGLLESLSAVLILENNSFPKGLSTPKSPALLLNALLAHHLYSTMFRDPFFFFEGGNGNESSQDTGGGLFRGIYRMAQEANKKSAHGWRSQTLRLLHPALGADTTDGERQMRATTEKAIAKISRKQASSFLCGAARYLLSPNINKEEMEETLRDIYQETGTLSYSLWTQKTTLTCHSTLSEMGPRTFDAKSKYLKPHPLVNYDDHDDKLKGKPITLIVHPLIQAFGTGDGKDYNKGRIWASAEVWLDSK